MKKRFYLIQIGVSYSSPCFLPYGAGCIYAYLKNDPEITRVYDLADIIVMREPLDRVMERFDAPDIAAFSCAVWNYEYNKQPKYRDIDGRNASMAGRK